METTVALIPESAWVQAVFVVLFIVLVVSLLMWSSKQQEKWQKFIQERDIQYQNWMDKSENRTAEQLGNVADTLQKLADKMDAHDDKVENRINNLKPLPNRSRK